MKWRARTKQCYAWQSRIGMDGHFLELNWLTWKQHPGNSDRTRAIYDSATTLRQLKVGILCACVLALNVNYLWNGRKQEDNEPICDNASMRRTCYHRRNAFEPSVTSNKLKRERKKSENMVLLSHALRVHACDGRLLWPDTQTQSAADKSHSKNGIPSSITSRWSCVCMCACVYAPNEWHRMLLECCIYSIKVRNIYYYAIWAVMCAMSGLWCAVCVAIERWRWWWWSVA